MFPYRIQQRYRMLRLLGEGGMGAVFEAEDEKLRRPVAVKIIASERINEGDTRARFEREARIVARLQSPAVISLYDSGELFDGSAFLIMELLKGLDLAKLLERDGPGSPSQVALVLEQVSEGLSAAHALGVIHRDLKPGNIFLIPTAGGNFHVKLLDFGLAKHTVDDVSATRAGFIVGSPGYMSPEQLREELLDQRSDLFSLATLAYELLTGVAAFQGKGVAEIFTAILQSNPPPLEDYLPDAPRELEDAFEIAFAKSRTDRPDSVADWVAMLLPVLRQMPSSSAGWKVEQPGSGGPVRA
jgi:serine/threonine protein kinase